MAGLGVSLATVANLTDKQAELIRAKDALNAARLAQSYGQGDRSLQRANLSDLEIHVARIQRDIDALTALAAGAVSPLFVTAAYRGFPLGNDDS